MERVGKEIWVNGKLSLISAVYPSCVALYGIKDRKLYYANRKYIEAFKGAYRPPEKIRCYLFQKDETHEKYHRTRILDTGHPVFFYDLLDGLPVIHSGSYVCGSCKRVIVLYQGEYKTLNPDQVFTYSHFSF